MTLWLLQDGYLVDVVVEPHLGEVYTVCADSLEILEPIIEISPEPAFNPILNSRFKWAVHVPMNRVMPEGWDFLGLRYAFKSEKLAAPISPNPVEWYWEAVKVYDIEGDRLETPEGEYGYEFMTDPAELLQDLRNCDYEDACLVPVYRTRVNQTFLDKSAEEWEAHPDEWEIEEGEE